MHAGGLEQAEPGKRRLAGRAYEDHLMVDYSPSGCRYSRALPYQDFQMSSAYESLDARVRSSDGRGHGNGGAAGRACNMKHDGEL